ncbi:alpha/beta hydrolase fold family protein [Rhodococcus sp. MTM3W5.2]|uniref:alpha/beta fold hydrolase n=1 Tax=Rhodococcus sp. MTM3W5.2 TaxID=1805827 RepID=UPI0009793A09|nr:alpha/beta hydrolase [Rhodococcus sp. MTM3W5.2]AQA25677.1 alpha/beta hydrolase fold family protein [Rhodococcus sp. MTM3W5.2]
MTQSGTNLETERWIETTAGPVHLRERGAPTGSPLLFVHGALVDSHLWDGVADRAAALGYRCLLPTLPLGSHTRPMNPGADLKPPALADLVAEVVGQLGLSQVTVVGNDTGGGLSQILTARHPDLVRTLVLTACDAYEQFPPRSLRAFFALGRAPGVLALGGQLMRLRAARRFAIPRPLSHRGPGDEVIAGWTRPLRDPMLRRDTVKFFAGSTPRTPWPPRGTCAPSRAARCSSGAATTASSPWTWAAGWPPTSRTPGSRSSTTAARSCPSMRRTGSPVSSTSG